MLTIDVIQYIYFELNCYNYYYYCYYCCYYQGGICDAKQKGIPSHRGWGTYVPTGIQGQSPSRGV